MKTSKFARKPFFVDAVQVTAENIDEVAKWCQGDVRSVGLKAGPNDEGVINKYIKVRVTRPLNVRQTQAFVGDWVLYAGTGYKVYTDAAFHKSFEPTIYEPADNSVKLGGVTFDGETYRVMNDQQPTEEITTSINSNPLIPYRDN